MKDRPRKTPTCCQLCLQMLNSDMFFYVRMLNVLWYKHILHRGLNYSHAHMLTAASHSSQAGCNQRLDSGWTESLNRVTCKLCENRERHRSLIIRDRGVCCSYSSYHPVARIERAEPDRKRWRGKATRKRHETRGQEVSRRGTSWPRRVQSTGWTSCRSGRQEPTARRTHWGQPLREERRGEAERQRRLFQA